MLELAAKLPGSTSDSPRFLVAASRDASGWIDYLQIANFNGDWKTILWGQVYVIHYKHLVYDVGLTPQPLSTKHEAPAR